MAHTNLFDIQVHLWNPCSPLHAVDVALVLQSLLHVVLHAVDVDATLVLPSLLRAVLPLHEMLPRLLQVLPLEHLLSLPCEAL